MKKLFKYMFVLLFIQPFGFTRGQDTKMVRMCQMGYEKIFVYLKYSEGNYYLYTYLVSQKSFYVDEGSVCELATVNNDTVRVIGLLKGEPEIADSQPGQSVYHPAWAFWNKYLLNPEQVNILKSKELKIISIAVAGEVFKMDVETYVMDGVVKLFEKLDKKIKKKSK
jgi:hypothetical protein